MCMCVCVCVCVYVYVCVCVCVCYTLRLRPVICVCARTGVNLGIYAMIVMYDIFSARGLRKEVDIIKRWLFVVFIQ